MIWVNMDHGRVFASMLIASSAQASTQKGKGGKTAFRSVRPPFLVLCNVCSEVFSPVFRRPHYARQDPAWFFRHYGNYFATLTPSKFLSTLHRALCFNFVLTFKAAVAGNFTNIHVFSSCLVFCMFSMRLFRFPAEFLICEKQPEFGWISLLLIILTFR